MKDTLEKDKEIQMSHDKRNMLNEDDLDQVNGGVSPLWYAMNGASGIMNIFSDGSKKNKSGSGDKGLNTGADKK